MKHLRIYISPKEKHSDLMINIRRTIKLYEGRYIETIFYLK